MSRYQTDPEYREKWKAYMNSRYTKTTGVCCMCNKGVYLSRYYTIRDKIYCKTCILNSEPFAEFLKWTERPP